MNPILIVGAGPTGLVLALSLARRGVPFRIIDRNAGPGQASRAMAVQARTLEFYAQFGFADEIVSRGIKMETLHLRSDGKEFARLKLGNIGEGLSPYPFVLSFPQDAHETFLTHELQLLGVSVEWGVELKDLSDHGSHMRCLLDKDGTGQAAEFAYVCGCDGASSTVRQHLNLTFSGGTYDHVFYVADVKIAGEPSTDFFINLGRRELGIVLPVRAGTKRLIGIVPESLKGRSALTFEDLAPRAEKLMHIKVEEVNWFSAYRVHHRIAGRFRVGRAFLLGDAGHVHSPVGGQGMNTGIGDAINLAWKLADVMRGRAPEAILDSYEHERISFARTLVETTDKLFRWMVDPGVAGNLLRSGLLPAFLPLLSRQPALRRGLFRTVSQIRLHYPHSLLSDGTAGKICGGDRLPWVRANGSDNFHSLKTLDWQIHVYGELNALFRARAATLGLPLMVFEWNPDVRRAGLECNAFYLVRPDGYVALASSVQDADVLSRFCRTRGLVQTRG
jgi:2-polyprenyl-6-methoxyphenol hydroxylase-like FAD-dependent oxidoreductase